MSDKYQYDYYYVDLPADLFDGDGRNKEFGQQAITEAEERTKLYACPCIWTAEVIRENGLEVCIKVRRKRNRR